MNSYKLILVQFRNHRLKIDPYAKFQPDWTKDNEARISTWNDTKKCLLTSYLPLNDYVSKMLTGFETTCPKVPPCHVWWYLDHK